MSMGAFNAPATFQTWMNQIFQDCIDDFFIVHIEDFQIFSKYDECNYRHLKTILNRLEESKIYAYLKKREFMKDEMGFLGMLIGKNSIEVNPEKTKVFSI